MSLKIIKKFYPVKHFMKKYKSDIYTRCSFCQVHTETDLLCKFNTHKSSTTTNQFFSSSWKNLKCIFFYIYIFQSVYYKKCNLCKEIIIIITNMHTRQFSLITDYFEKVSYIWYDHLILWCLSLSFEDKKYGMNKD